MQQHDEAQVRDFLRDHFAGLRDGELIEIRAFPSDRGAGTIKQGWFATPDEAARYVLTTPVSYDIYFGVNPRSGRGGTKEDVSRITHLWADFDDKKFTSREEASHVLDSFEVPPTAITETGNGRHLYWRLADPPYAEEEGARIERTLDRLYVRLGDLDRVRDYSRVLRVPGTWNNKPHADGPRQARIALPDTGQAHTLAQLEAPLPALPPTHLRPRAGHTLTSEAEDGKPSIEEVRRMLSFINPCLPREEYIAVWMGVASIYPGPEGAELIDEWSSQAREDYRDAAHPRGLNTSPRKQPNLHRGFRRSGVGIGTTIHYARQGGYIPPSPPVPQMVRKQKGGKAMPGECGDTLVITSLSTVAPVPIRWLWPRWLARGKVTILGGHPGDGKSTLTAALAATLSRGGVWPDGTPAPQGKTLFLLAEDALDDTLRPRLDRLGADVSRVDAIEAVRNPDGQDRSFNIERHLQKLEAAIVEYGFDLLVIDPLTSFMQQSDRNGEGDVRDLLTPLGKMAERTGAAILGIMHVGKPNGTSRRPVQQLLGATAFGAVARSVWMIAPLSQAQGETHRVLGVVKSNLSMKPPSLEWSMEEDTPIAWHGPTGQDIAELLGGGRPATKRDEAGEMIRAFLADGPLLNNDLHDRCEAAGISTATRRRAEGTIGTETWKEPAQDGRFWTGLPGQKEAWYAQWHRGVFTATDVAHPLYT